MAEEFDRDCGRFRRTVNEESDGGASVQATNDFDKCEWIFADDERFNAPTGARSLAKISEGRLRLSLGYYQERDAPLAEERRAEFPVP